MSHSGSTHNAEMVSNGRSEYSMRFSITGSLSRCAALGPQALVACYISLFTLPGNTDLVQLSMVQSAQIALVVNAHYSVVFV